MTHGVTPAKLVRELAGPGAVGEGATPCTDGRPPENTPAWIASHQSSLPTRPKDIPRDLEMAWQRFSRTRANLDASTQLSLFPSAPSILTFSIIRLSPLRRCGLLNGKQCARAQPASAEPSTSKRKENELPAWSFVWLRRSSQ